VDRGTDPRAGPYSVRARPSGDAAERVATAHPATQEPPVAMTSTPPAPMPATSGSPSSTSTPGTTSLCVVGLGYIGLPTSAVLASRGYTVLEAGSGGEALELLDGGAPKIDLVISDVVMPGIDGPALVEELKKRNVAAKVIFISGYAEDTFRKTLAENDDIAFLPKPFSLKQLAAAVKKALTG